jgi:hypothetical protein
MIELDEAKATFQTTIDTLRRAAGTVESLNPRTMTTQAVRQSYAMIAKVFHSVADAEEAKLTAMKPIEETLDAAELKRQELGERLEAWERYFQANGGGELPAGCR